MEKKGQKSTNAYMIYAGITTVIWATAAVFTQSAQESFSSQSAGVIRYLFATAAILVVMAVKRIGPPSLKDVPKFLLSGFLGFTCYVTTFNLAMESITGATCSIIGQVIPILTAVFSCVILREKIPLRGWTAIAMAFAGILVMALWNGAFSVDPGILWMLLAAVSLSAYNLTQRVFVKDYTAFQATAYSIIGGTLFLLVFLPGAVPEMREATAAAWGSVAYLGVFGGAVAYVFWTKAFSLAERTSDVSNFMFAQPLLASLIGFFFRGEVPGIETVLGGILVLGGMFLFQTGKKTG
ncbi:MAG: EamA family transporter [Lachnospiraceae bacterium]|nr:EamA family transporter [Lachnospiraceae bacterium]